MDDGITPSEFHSADGTADWRVLGDGATAFFRASSVAESARLVAAIGALPGVDDHVPDVTSDRPASRSASSRRATSGTE